VAVDPLEWYHSLQNFPTNIIFDFERKKNGFHYYWGHFSNWLSRSLAFLFELQHGHGV